MKRFVGCLLIAWLLLPGLSYAATISPFAKGSIEGYLQEMTFYPGNGIVPDGYSARIENYDGGVFNLRIHPDAVLTIDQLPVKPSTFRAGMEVYGQLRGQSLMSLEAYSATQMAYLEPESRVRTGIVRKIDRDQLQIELATREKLICFVGPGAMIQRGGQPVPMSSLYEGDRVKVYFNEANSDQVSRLLIMGNSIIIRDVLRATLQNVDSPGNRVMLKDVQVMRNTRWEKDNALLQIQLPSAVQVYSGGQSIPARQLKNYCGRDVYLAVRKVMGKDVVEKMIVKSQYESIYQEQIADINWYTEAMELKNKQNLGFNDGTIIVKEGRLVDKYALQQGMDAMVVADGRMGSGTASFINIVSENLNHSNASQYYIYEGRLDQIADNSLWLRNFNILNDQAWESYSDEKELFYSQDTSVYDLEKQKYLSTEELLAGDYAVDENSSRVKEHRLADYYAYLFTDGDQILGMVVQKSSDSLLRQRVSAGIIKNISKDEQLGSIVTLRDIRDWSSSNSRWMTRDTEMRLTFSRCMVIKNGKVIQPEDLKSGDQLYVVRDDFYGKIAVVK